MNRPTSSVARDFDLARRFAQGGGQDGDRGGLLYESEGKSLREISEIPKHDFRTVQKYA
jgi:hypothetical protein